MVYVDSSSLLADSHAKSVGLVSGLVAIVVLSLHSSNEPSELSQWPRYDDSTTNIVIIRLESRLQPNIGNTLRPVLMVYTHAFRYNLAESEPNWIKSGAL